jgi:hypothetical protein
MVRPRIEAPAAASGESDEDYSKTLHDWIRARWHPPPGISDDQLRRLCVVTRIWTTSQLRIWKVLGQPVLSSGNASFDESVHASLESAIDEGAALPEPKAIEMSRSLRKAMITLAFTLGDPRLCR